MKKMILFLLCAVFLITACGSDATITAIDENGKKEAEEAEPADAEAVNAEADRQITEAATPVPTTAAAAEVPSPAAEAPETAAPAVEIPALPADEFVPDFPKDADERINFIRSLYYGYTENQSAFEAAATGNITGYWKKSNQELRLVTVKDEYFGNSQLSAEYYFAEDRGAYNLYFVFAHNADYSVEHRIYLWENRVFRYIGPYEADETTYNYEPSIAYDDAQLSGRDEAIPALISRGFRELHLYGYR